MTSAATPPGTWRSAEEHSCSGAPLIRLAVAVATGALLSMTSAVEPVGEVEWIGGFAIRAPASLPVVLRREALDHALSMA